MEQNTAGNAPGPATAEDIATLPKKQVDGSMLGEQGKAECSICMDSVGLGDEVTELYCHHWFHTACVAAWLREHDTCPHCRLGTAEAKQLFEERARSKAMSGSASGDKS
jgi:hypothetical protein